MNCARLRFVLALTALTTCTAQTSLTDTSLRRPAPSAWLLLRGMRPVRTARVRASDVASCGALHASRKLDLVLPPFSGQAYGAGTVESCALMAAPRLLERRFSTPDTFPGRKNRLGINRGYADHRRHLTAHPLQYDGVRG